jgi:hypothetical protein
MDDFFENETEEVVSPLPNMLEHSYYFEQASVGLASHEYARISLAIKQLIEKYQLKAVRFWGKIFGTQKNYYIVEAKFQEEIDEIDDEKSEITENQSDYEQVIKNQNTLKLLRSNFFNLLTFLARKKTKILYQKLILLNQLFQLNKMVLDVTDLTILFVIYVG